MKPAYVIAPVVVAVVVATWMATGSWIYLAGEPNPKMICEGELGVIYDARKACTDACEQPGCDDDCVKACRAGCSADAKTTRETLAVPVQAAKDSFAWCAAECAGSQQYVIESQAETSKMHNCVDACGDESCAKQCRDDWNAERLERLAAHRTVCPEGLYVCQWNAVINGSSACSVLMNQG